MRNNIFSTVWGLQLKSDVMTQSRANSLAYASHLVSPIWFYFCTVWLYYYTVINIYCYVRLVYYYRIPLFYQFLTPLLYNYTTVLYYQIAIALHYYSIILLYIAILHYCNTILLICSYITTYYIAAL